MIDLILEQTRNPLAIAGLILMSTWILEDAAIISAALISIDGFIAPELAFSGTVFRDFFRRPWIIRNWTFIKSMASAQSMGFSLVFKGENNKSSGLAP